MFAGLFAAAIRQASRSARENNSRKNARSPRCRINGDFPQYSSKNSRVVWGESRFSKLGLNANIFSAPRVFPSVLPKQAPTGARQVLRGATVRSQCPQARQLSLASPPEAARRNATHAVPYLRGFVIRVRQGV